MGVYVASVVVGSEGVAMGRGMFVFSEEGGDVSSLRGVSSTRSRSSKSSRLRSGWSISKNAGLSLSIVTLTSLPLQFILKNLSFLSMTSYGPSYW